MIADLETEIALCFNRSTRGGHSRLHVVAGGLNKAVSTGNTCTCVPDYPRGPIIGSRVYRELLVVLTYLRSTLTFRRPLMYPGPRDRMQSLSVVRDDKGRYSA